MQLQFYRLIGKFRMIIVFTEMTQPNLTQLVTEVVC